MAVVMPDPAQPVRPSMDVVSAMVPATNSVEPAVLKQERDGVRTAVKTYLTTELQKGQVAVEKARAVALAAKEEIEAAHTVTECTEVIQHLAVKFPETLDGLVVKHEESVSRGAELEIAGIIVHWIQEGKVDWAASLGREAAETAKTGDVVGVLHKIKQEVGV